MNFKILIFLLLSASTMYGQKLTKSPVKYQTWDGKYHEVYVGVNHVLIVKYSNGTTKKLVDLEADEKRDHPCRYRDGHRSAPGKSVCQYHVNTP